MIFFVLHQYEQGQGLSLFVQQLPVKHSFNFWYIFAALYGIQRKNQFPVIHAE